MGTSLHVGAKMTTGPILVKAQVGLFFKDLVRYPERIGENVDAYIRSVSEKNSADAKEGELVFSDTPPFFELGITNDRMDLIFDMAKGNNKLTLEMFSALSEVVLDYISENLALSRVGVVTTYFTECRCPVQYLLDKYTKIHYSETKKEVSIKINDEFYIDDVECNEIKTYFSRDEEAKYVKKIGYCTKIDVNSKFIENGLQPGFEKKIFNKAIEINTSI